MPFKNPKIHLGRELFVIFWMKGEFLLTPADAWCHPVDCMHDGMPFFGNLRIARLQKKKKGGGGLL